MTGSTLAGVTTAYGWDADVNRTSVQVGAGTAATTAYDAADRPASGTDPAATYNSDPDGRLTVAPGYRYEWDHLGRLTKVLPPSGNNALATYSYDPLDRLRLVDHGGADRTRFRYVGLTTNVAQWLDDQAGTVTRSVANGWTGDRLADWTGSGSNLRFYGTNAHHDVTWLAGSTGTVSQSLRYDPWGNPRSTVPTGYSPFRFQGSYVDDASALSWVVTRWYAHTLGRFISEDTLLGDPVDPPSRHLYAYGAGEPVGRWDPDGRAYKPGAFSWRVYRDRTIDETDVAWKAASAAYDILCLFAENSLSDNPIVKLFSTMCPLGSEFLAQTEQGIAYKRIRREKVLTAVYPAVAVRFEKREGFRYRKPGGSWMTKYSSISYRWEARYYKTGTPPGRTREIYDANFRRCRDWIDDGWNSWKWPCQEPGAYSQRIYKDVRPWQSGGDFVKRSDRWPRVWAP